jgi:hypothetical protein
VKAVVLDGSLTGDETLAMPREILAAELGFRDWEVEAALLRELRIADCAGCYSCWIATPGLCRVNDAGRDVARLTAVCDLLVFLTPITFGGYSSELKKAVDRLIPNISPFFENLGGEIHHRRRYPAAPALLAIGLAPDRDDERAGIFRRLVERNAINLRSPAHAAAVVGLGWGGDELRREILMALAAAGVEV